MHETTLPLGPYANDPRIQTVKVDGRDAVRTDRVTITQGAGDYQVWPLGDPDAIYPAHTDRSLRKALAYDLGDPCKVGPVGISDWLHTDGRTYKHDPATTGMIDAGYLRPGDVVDFPHLPAFEILRPATPMVDGIGQWPMTYPVRRLDNNKAATFSPRSGDMIPIRFAR